MPSAWRSAGSLNVGTSTAALADVEVRVARGQALAVEARAARGIGSGDHLEPRAVLQSRAPCRRSRFSSSGAVVRVRGFVLAAEHDACAGRRSGRGRRRGRGCRRRRCRARARARCVAPRASREDALEVRARRGPGLRTCTSGSSRHSSVVSSVPRPLTSMLPPSSTTGRPVALDRAAAARPSARAARAGTRSSCFQSGYLAQALKRKRAMATSRAAVVASRRWARSRASSRGRWGSGRTRRGARSTPDARQDAPRAAPRGARRGTRMRTRSPGASWRTISP